MAQLDWSLLQTPDYFGNALKAQAMGQEQAAYNTKQNALKQYASDPEGAITQLAPVDPATAANLQRLQSAKAQAAARSTAASQVQGGDMTGARQTALASGDDQLMTAINQMDENQRAQAKQAAQNFAVVGVGLKKIPYEQRRQALQAMAPDLAKQGIKPEQIANYDPTDTNIDSTVNGALGLAAAVDRADKLSKPIELDPNRNYYLPDSGSGAQPAAGATPPPAGQGAAPTQTAANPDAVWAAIKQQESGGNGNAVGPQTPYGQAQGSTQMLMSTAEGQARKLGVAWRPDLMRGDTPNALAYQDKLGRAYFQEGMDKYGGDVSKATAYYFGGPNERLWGPKTQQYVQDVSARVGSGNGAPPPPPPNDAGPNVQPAGSYQVAANGATPAPPSIPGYRLISQGRPQWQSDGRGTLVNANGDLKKDPTFEAPAAPADPNIVKGLLDGRIMPPTQKAAATPYWQAQLETAAQQDPNFDMVNYQARAKTRADFTSGKSAQNITALNTVIGHLDHLDRTIDGLGNSGPGGALNFGPLNSLNNTAARAMAGASTTDARYKNFETAKTAVANELTRVFRGTGGAEADIQGWMKQLDGAGSPEALHQVVQSMAELINSRVEALGEQYNQGMGTTKDPITLLTADKQTAFNRMMGRKPTAAAPSSGAQVIHYDAQGNRVQ